MLCNPYLRIYPLIIIFKQNLYSNRPLILSNEYIFIQGFFRSENQYQAYRACTGQRLVNQIAVIATSYFYFLEMIHFIVGCVIVVSCCLLLFLLHLSCRCMVSTLVLRSTNNPSLPFYPVVQTHQLSFLLSYSLSFLLSCLLAFFFFESQQHPSSGPTTMRKISRANDDEKGQHDEEGQHWS